MRSLPGSERDSYQTCVVGGDDGRVTVVVCTNVNVLYHLSWYRSYMARIRLSPSLTEIAVLAGSGVAAVDATCVDPPQPMESSEGTAAADHPPPIRVRFRMSSRRSLPEPCFR